MNSNFEAMSVEQDPSLKGASDFNYDENDKKNTASMMMMDVDDDKTMSTSNDIVMETNSNTTTVTTSLHNEQQQQQQKEYEALLASLPENRFELELEFIQALASPAYIHFLATSCRLDDDDNIMDIPSNDNNNNTQQQQSIQKQSTLQQLQPFLHYLFNTYTQPQYARFLKYPHALFFLQSLLIYDDDDNPKTNTNTGNDNNDVNEIVSSNQHPSSTTNNTNKLHIEWTLPAYRNFCYQQQFLAWQYRHSTCYGVGSHTNPLLPTDNGTTINDQQDTNASSES